MTETVDLNRWGVICYDMRVQQHQIKGFFEEFIRCASKYGFHMHNHPVLARYLEPADGRLEENLIEFNSRAPEAQLIFVILPDKSQSFYGSLCHLILD